MSLGRSTAEVWQIRRTSSASSSGLLFSLHHGEAFVRKDLRVMSKFASLGAWIGVYDTYGTSHLVVRYYQLF